MFKFLKEKIESWTKNLVKKAEEDEKKSEKKKAEEKTRPVDDKNRPVSDKSRSEKKPEKKIKKIKVKLEEPEKEKKGFFQRIGEKISKIKISEKEFGIYEEELENLLLENNVALEAG